MSNTYHHGHKRKEILFGDMWKFYDNEPKWWRKMVKYKVRRQHCRKCINDVMHGDLDTMWPLDKKPREYYW